MTVEDRDQWECLLAGWSVAHDITRGDDDNGPLPFKAVSPADPGALLETARPRILRSMISGCRLAIVRHTAQYVLQISGRADAELRWSPPAAEVGDPHRVASLAAAQALSTGHEVPAAC